MRSFQQSLPEFTSRGIRVVALSTDPPEINGPHRQKLGLTYTLLSDTSGEVLRRYDLLHERAGPKGSDIARPAEILLDSTGTIRWINLTENAALRARPQHILDAWDALQPSTMLTNSVARLPRSGHG